MRVLLVPVAIALVSCAPSPCRASDPAPRAGDALRLLEDRVARDPGDPDLLVALGQALVEKGRETGDSAWFDRAGNAVDRALALRPGHYDALVTRGRVSIARHAFADAAADARRAVDLDPERPAAHAVLGDALVNAGEVDGASRAYERLAALAPGFNAEVRLAHLDELRGDPRAAEARLERSIVTGLVRGVPAASLAWVHAVLGDLLFSQGALLRAEGEYRGALAAQPASIAALSGLGRVAAARGDLPEAARQLERAAAITPLPSVLATLGDVYRLLGEEEEARRRHALIESIARLRLDAFGRDLALFYADHDLDPGEAVRLASRELRSRRDVHTYDVLSWALLKAGRLEEAREASCEALRLGTRDPRLLYHAGMVARALGERARAAAFLCDALSLNPSFDVLQAPVARKLLEGEPPTRPCPASPSGESSKR